MSLSQKKFRAALIGSAASLCLVTPALATSFTVPAGTTDTTPKTVEGGDTGTIDATGTLSADLPITWLLTTANTAPVTINNSGSIAATNVSNGIDTSGTGGPRSFTFNNLTAGSSLTTTQGDAFRISSSIGTGTVTVNNSGTIQATGGLALNFSAAGAGATTLINNLAGGQIVAQGFSAIRPGNNATINNFGLINGGSSFGDATIDFQAGNTGTINNMTGGTIEGAGPIIFGRTAITVNNDGTIQSGAAQGIDLETTSGTAIINNTANGIISAVGIHGTGEAIHVGYLATITNSGMITTTGTFGNTPIYAISIGGGTITNQAGGVIKANVTAINVGDAFSTNAPAAVTIDNAGSIQGGIALNSAQDNTFTNRAGGVVTGNVALGAGNDTANLYVGSSVQGTLDGGAGANLLTLNGSGDATLGDNTTNFQTLQVLGGNWTIGGNAKTYSTSMSVAGSSGLIIGTTVTTPTLTLNNGSVTTVLAPGKLMLGNGIVWAVAGSGSGVRLDNKGTINAGGRGIDTTGSSANSSFNLTNESGALLTAVSDAFRVNVSIGTGTIIVNNLGTSTIQSTGTGRALALDGGASSDVVIDNGVGAIIQAAANDAVDLRTSSNFVNSGTIQSTGAKPAGTTSAIDFGGGQLVNTASGVIESVQRAITVDDGSGGNAFAAVTIDNSGTITGHNGEAIRITSLANSLFLNRQTGIVNGSVTMGAGDDSIILTVGSKLNGALDGGAGNDTLSLVGTGVDSFGGGSNIENLEVGGGGVWTLTGTQTYSGGVKLFANANLIVANTLNTPTTTMLNGSALKILAGAALNGTNAIVWDMSGPGSDTGIDNKGTITATGRGIDTTGSGGTVNFVLANEAGALLTAASDAFRINGDPGAGPVTVNNSGTIQSTGTGRALSFNAGITLPTATITINNLTGGIIQAAGDDAIRPGTGHVTIANSGMIQSTAAAGRAINLNTTNLTSLVSFGLTNAAAATIQSPGDAVRITAANLQPTATYAVTVDNSGTIKSTGTGANNGQAIDFGDLVAPTGTVTITNRAGGVLQAADADAVRPGNNSTVNNFGTISGLSAGGTGNDGIDFQSGDSGTVNNMTGGTITGARHGITGDLAQTINNDGAITGQAGAGINLDTTTGTTVINNTAHGVITGNAVTSDGDAIDVDFLVNIHNAGTIKAVGTFAGETNEALAIGGGSVVNSAGGLITSAQRAITVDDSALGNAFGAVDIDNAGTITGQDGEAIRITSVSANTLENRATGAINGSVVMGGGTDNVTLFAGSSISGTLDGGAGNDTLTLSGPGTATTAGGVNFETLALNGGNWTLSGTQTYATATTVAANTTFAVNGALHTGTLHIANGATYNVTVNPSTAAGTIAATGAVTIDGGSVAVTATPGIYANVTHYTLISGSSVSGSFAGGVTVDQAFLTPTLTYSATEVDLTLTRNINFLSQFAITPNQMAVAGALDASSVNSPLFLGVATLSGAAARAALDSLSGEVHASFGNVLIGDTQDMQAGVLERLVQDPPDEPAALWAQGVGDWRTIDGSGGTFGQRASNGGVLVGYDRAMGENSRLGVAAGYSAADSQINALSSRAHANALDFTLYGETSIGGALHLRAGAGYTDYTSIHTTRTVTVPSAQTLTANYHGSAWHGFAEASYPIAMGNVALEPVLNVNAVGLSTDAYTETGGSAALSGAAQDQTTAYTTLGLRLSDTFEADGRTFTPRLLAGWQHAFGDVGSSVLQTFTSTGTSFTIAGAPIGRDAAVFDAGFDVTGGHGLKLSLSYMGQFSQHGSANGVNVGVAWNF